MFFTHSHTQARTNRRHHLKHSRRTAPVDDPEKKDQHGKTRSFDQGRGNPKFHGNECSVQCSLCNVPMCRDYDRFDVQYPETSHMTVSGSVWVTNFRTG